MSGDTGGDDGALRAALPPSARERVQSLRLADGVATLVIDVAGMDRLERDKLEIAVKDALRGQPGVTEVRVAMTADRPAPGPALRRREGRSGVSSSSARCANP